MRYLASIGYNGSKYFGFQKLKDHNTIQEELEKALTKINKNYVYVKGAGRTDRGVHAFNQRVSFDLDVDIPLNNLKKAINSLLPDDIYVNDVNVVDDNFHARFDAKKKIYQYVINMGEFDPLDNDFLYNYCHKLNIINMKKASKLIEGFHDYKAFTGCVRDNYNSVIYSIKFKVKKDILLITFEGKSFYRYMVRNIVGFLIQVGEGKVSYEMVNKIFDKRKNITNYVTSPSCGLYLVDVIY